MHPDGSMLQVSFRCPPVVPFLTGNSGILLLDAPEFSSSITSEASSRALSDETASILESASKMTLRFSDALVSKVSDLISPFLPFLIYKVTSLRLKISFRHGSDAVDKHNTEEMRLALKHLGSRWLAAGMCTQTKSSRNPF